MMVVEQNRYLQAWLKFSQLKPATNMQLPSCESDLNKTRCVDLVTERPGQTEGSFTGQSQAEITYLVAHFSFVFILHFSASHRADDGQIKTSPKWRGIFPRISLAFGWGHSGILSSYFILFPTLTLRIQHILGRGCFNENNNPKFQVGFICHVDLQTCQALSISTLASPRLRLWTLCCLELPPRQAWGQTRSLSLIAYLLLTFRSGSGCLSCSLCVEKPQRHLCVRPQILLVVMSSWSKRCHIMSSCRYSQFSSS